MLLFILQGPQGPAGPPGNQGHTGPPVSNHAHKSGHSNSLIWSLVLAKKEKSVTEWITRSRTFLYEGSTGWNWIFRQTWRAWKACELAFFVLQINTLFVVNGTFCHRCSISVAVSLFMSLNVNHWSSKGLPGKDGLDGLPGNDGATVSMTCRITSLFFV